MLPTEIKLCCRMLGMAMVAIRRSSAGEKIGAGPASGSADSRRSTAAIASRQLIPWHRKVAQATPATPILKAVTKRMSTKIFDTEETARNTNGVRESPNAEKMPVAIL